MTCHWEYITQFLVHLLNERAIKGKTPLLVSKNKSFSMTGLHTDAYTFQRETRLRDVTKLDSEALWE